MLGTRLIIRSYRKAVVAAGFAAASSLAPLQVRAESGDEVSVYQAVPERSVAGVAPLPTEDKDQSAAGPDLVNRSVPSVAEAKRAEQLKPLVVRYALENSVPYALADAVIRLESRYNAGARNGVNVGLTQINARTAQAMGYQGTPEGLLDPETNLRYGLKYLAQAYKLAGGDTCGTILRYQAGHRAQSMTRAAQVYCIKVQTILATAG